MIYRSQSSLVFVLFLCMGCSDGLPTSKLHRQAVSGSVSLDSKPLTNGAIAFHPLSPTGESTVSGSLIKDGAFKLTDENGLPPGKYKVVITSSAAEGNLTTDPEAAMDAASKPPAEGPPIPAKYNSNTELTCEIVDGPNESLSFDLKSGS
tara:strand:- start:44029 stop:44478 length:450 start_codon:yes stop_codon:yes gene_type:complete